MQCVSSHWLIAILQSPAECWKRYIDPSREIQEPSDSMRFGTLMHLLLLTPRLFEKEIIVSDFERRSKAGKSMYNDLVATGKTIVKPKEVYKAECIVDAVKKNNDANNFIRYGSKERPFIKERANGLLPLKARLDVFCKKRDLIVEFKTIYSLKGISAAMERYRYLLSASFYQYLSGGAKVIFVFVETKEPYNVEIIETTNEQLDCGHEQWVSGLKTFDKCWEKNEWPEIKKIPEIEEYHCDSLRHEKLIYNKLDCGELVM